MSLAEGPWGSADPFVGGHRELVNGVDDLGPERFRQIVAHAFHEHHPGTVQGLMGIVPAFGSYERIFRAMNHQRRQLQRFESRSAIAVGGDGRHLPGNAFRIKSPVVAFCCPGAGHLLRHRIGGRPDHFRHHEGPLDGAFPGVGSWAEHGTHSFV